MKFEEALQHLREGKKIRNPYFEENVYLMACRVGLIGDSHTPIEEKPISIVKMKGDRQHDEMLGKMNYVAKIKKQLKNILTDEEYKKYHNSYTEIYIAKIFDQDIFKYPHINLLLIMLDDWEVIE